MNERETAAAIALLAHSWPGDMTTESMSLWSRDLAKLDPDVVRDTLEDLRRTSEFRPTLSAFLEAKNSVIRRRNNVRALPEPKGDRDLSAEMFHSLRAVLLVARKPHEHQHKRGRHACPVCYPHDLNAHRLDRDSESGRVRCERCVFLAEVFQAGRDEFHELGGAA